MSTVAISAQDINKLRQATGAGMMDCRKALTETNGDFEAAIDWLRKQGQKVAAKRSDREAKEGVVIAKTTADHKTGIVVCVSCETDFVSKNADFVAFGQSIADAAIANNVKNLEELMKLYEKCYEERIPRCTLIDVIENEIYQKTLEKNQWRIDRGYRLEKFVPKKK